MALEQLQGKVLQAVRLIISSDETPTSNVLECYTFTISDEKTARGSDLGLEVQSSSGARLNLDLRENLFKFLDDVQQLCTAQNVLPGGFMGSSQVVCRADVLAQSISSSLSVCLTTKIGFRARRRLASKCVSPIT